MTSESHARSGEVTQLLAAARAGDDDALQRVVPLVYDDLRALAERQLRRENSGHTLGATALVHESYMRLIGSAARAASGRSHFLAIAARSMRQVLVDHARRLASRKRGGEWQRTTLGGNEVGTVELEPDELIALDDALAQLEPRQRQVVECRFFGGMEESEIAEALGLSERTVRRDWVKARAWLHAALAGDTSASAEL